VQDAACVHVRHRAQHHAHLALRARLAEARLRHKRVEELTAAHQLEHQVQLAHGAAAAPHAALGRAHALEDIEQLAHVRVRAERAQHRRLARERAHRLCPSARVRARALHRNHTAGGAAAGAAHGREVARAERLAQIVQQLERLGVPRRRRPGRRALVLPELEVQLRVHYQLRSRAHR